MIDLIRRLRWHWLSGTLAIVTASCASVPPQTPAASADHELVSEGYSLMYDTVSKLKFGDELLLIKIESDAVDAIISDISVYSEELQGRLEELAERDPVAKIDLELLPPMEIMKRESVTGERIPDLLSRTGKDFERLLLLSQSGALNQSRHLAKVMADTETDPERRAFWQEIQARFDDLYARVVDLLEQEYFS